MKILAILPTYRPPTYKKKVGGGEISNRVLLEGLVKKGHNVTVCTLDSGPVPTDNINGVKVCAKDNRLKPSALNRLVNILSYTSFVESEVIKNRPDVIITGTYGIRPALNISEKFGIPVGAFIRAFENFATVKESKSFFHSLLKRIIYGDVGSRALNRLDFILPNSVYMSGVCEKYVPSVPLKVIYPALSFNPLMTVKKNKTIKNIFMVNAAEHKGFEIFEYLSEEFPDLIFHVLGDVLPERKNLKFHGWVDVSKTLCEQADALLVPSICREAFGRVSLEGLSAGIPTIVSNIGGLPETVNYESFLLVDPGDKIAWRDAVFKLVSNPEIYQESTARAQAEISKYSVNNQVEVLENYLLSHIKRYSVSENSCE
jgi:glycosyltransferase involved in cell wall biosynthesis